MIAIKSDPLIKVEELTEFIIEDIFCIIFDSNYDDIECPILILDSKLLL